MNLIVEILQARFYLQTSPNLTAKLMKLIGKRYTRIVEWFVIKIVKIIKWWKYYSSPAARKSKTVTLENVLASISLLVDYTSKRRTITGAYILCWFFAATESRSSWNAGKDVQRGFCITRTTSLRPPPHSPYSLFRAPLDFHLLPRMMKAVNGEHYESNFSHDGRVLGSVRCCILRTGYPGAAASLNYE